MDTENALSKVTLMNEDISNRVHLLSDFLQCNGKMFVSCYNASGSLVETNYSNMIYDTIFRSSDYIQKAIAKGEESTKPHIISTTIGMMWAIVYEKDEYGQIIHLHTLGPVFSAALSDETIHTIQKNPKIREKWKPKFIGYLKDIPVITATEFFKYTLMLHYAVNKEYLKPSDLSFSNIATKDYIPTNSRKMNFSEYWARENAMLEMIKNGDIYYKSKITSASSILKDLNPNSDNELMVIKQYAVSFISLCIRASIDGGVSPDTAYIRGEMYMKNLIASKSFAEMLSVTHATFDDFIFLVHNHKEQPKYSEPISACMDYIEAHPDEPLNIDYLADRLGYSKYYLSKKFKAEASMSMNSYIKKTRIEKACYLLVTTKMDIQEISDLLHFGNRNFFTKVFKEETGTNPAAFRESHKRN